MLPTLNITLNALRTPPPFCACSISCGARARSADQGCPHAGFPDYWVLVGYSNSNSRRSSDSSVPTRYMQHCGFATGIDPARYPPCHSLSPASRGQVSSPAHLQQQKHVNHDALESTS
eukprot:1136325-Pelagomonas_calceolata.AAC.3